MFIEVECLEYNVLKKLLCEDIFAIHAPQFISSDIETKLSDQIIGYGFQKYLNAVALAWLRL